MGDCTPTYIVIRQGSRAIARASLWLVRNEPLRLPKSLRLGLRLFFQYRPLLICRSPLADTSGLILPEGSLREEAFRQLMMAARRELQRQHGSFLILDFLDPGQPVRTYGFRDFVFDTPGTRMDLEWPSFDAYLAQRDHRGRWHYKNSLSQADKMNLKLTKGKRVSDVQTAAALIENVFRKHGAPFNPWMRPFLENLEMVDGSWMEIRRKDRLVGCVVGVRDAGMQLGTALGLAKDIPFAYFRLIYALLEDAFEHEVKSIRLGSGAYEFKRRLGFRLEQNNHVAVSGAGSLANGLMDLISPRSNAYGN